MAKSASVKTSPALKNAWKLFEGGDKLSARREAEKVLEHPANPEEAQEAKDLLARTEPPTLFWILAAVALGAILSLVTLALLRS